MKEKDRVAGMQCPAIHISSCLVSRRPQTVLGASSGLMLAHKVHAI